MNGEEADLEFNIGTAWGIERAAEMVEKKAVALFLSGSDTEGQVLRATARFLREEAAKAVRAARGGAAILPFPGASNG